MSYEGVKQVQNYILERTLGKGTFGKVKLGYHTICEEYVAVKILEKKKIETDADVTRVQREIQILRKVDHKNVIKLYEILESDTNLYLVMEYASGGELFDYIVKKNQLPESTAAKYFIQLIDAVEYLHSLKIVHRDLKPENLLLDEARNLKVADFGLSNIYRENDQLKTACGSPCYAAPEMLYGKPYGGQKSDIWSCGIILYAMLCGFLPFEHDNTKKLYEMIKYEEYEKPKNISPIAQDLLAQLLMKDPDLRIGFNSIRQHPFFRKIIIHPQNTLFCKDNQVLKKMQELGYDAQMVLDQIQKNKHNSITSIFWLLSKKFTTQTINRLPQPQKKTHQLITTQINYQPLEFKQLQASTGGSNSKEKLIKQTRYSVPNNKTKIDYTQFSEAPFGFQTRLQSISMNVRRNTANVIDQSRQKTYSVQEKPHCQTPERIDNKKQKYNYIKKNTTEQVEDTNNNDNYLKEKIKELSKRSRNKTQPLKKLNDKMERYGKDNTEQQIMKNPQENLMLKFQKPSIRVRHRSNQESAIKGFRVLTHNFV